MADIGKVLEERGSRYGEFKNHAEIAQGLKHEMHVSPGWNRLDPDMKEALEMVQHKIARILNGDPQYLDNWVDGAGYFKLVADRLEAKSEPRPAPSNDGWIEWKGGECPVPKGTLVDIKTANGSISTRLHAGMASRELDSKGGFYALHWSMDNNDGDIIAYRLSPQTSQA